jgi:hypothetical protein
MEFMLLVPVRAEGRFLDILQVPAAAMVFMGGRIQTLVTLAISLEAAGFMQMVMKHTTQAIADTYPRKEANQLLPIALVLRKLQEEGAIARAETIGLCTPNPIPA